MPHARAKPRSCAHSLSFAKSKWNRLMRPLQPWADAIEARDPHLITSLYTADALLLATLEAQPLVGRQAIYPYFVNLARKGGLHVIWEAGWVVNKVTYAGLYTFKWDGGSVAARYTFVLSGDEIVHHHSSQMPT